MIPAVILAAGKSTRMGTPKALLPLGNETFLTRVIRTFREADVEEIIVVGGHEAPRVADLLADTHAPARLVVNADYESGQLSSILAGVRAIDRPGVNAMLLTLVDVPLVSAETVRMVVKRYRATRVPVVRPVDGVRHGHPVLIDRVLFDALRVADPNVGAKAVVRAHASADGDVLVHDEGAFVDVDTPEDYRRLDSPERRSV